ncbi:MAG: cellulose biosynthesis cyclic di-GMP-binding regulatory protein BcsB [Fimbriimonadaceae bacterium]
MITTLTMATLAMTGAPVQPVAQAERHDRSHYQSPSRAQVRRRRAATPPPPPPPIAPSPAVVTYNKRLFNEELIFKRPINEWSFFFNRFPTEEFVGRNYISLDYRHSPTILLGQSTMSILVNERPIASREVVKTPGESGSWVVEIPNNLLKDGFNEIRITSRQRSIEGLCRDVDNEANWVRFATSSHIVLNRLERTKYALRAYPWPYLDPLANEPVQAQIRLPESPAAGSIANLLALANDWGTRERFVPLRFPVASGDRSPASGQVLYLDAPVGQTPLAQGVTRVLAMSAGNGQPGAAVAFAGESAAVGGALEDMSEPKIVEQLPEFAAELNRVVEPNQKVLTTARMGTTRLSELGIGNIDLKGAFQREYSFGLNRPLLVSLGKTSRIHFPFRHSASLNPQRSTLTVAINGVLVASASMTPETANGGVLSARIPLSVLVQDRWNFTITAYHDLGLVDCSKVWDDVAWSVVDDSAEIILETGGLTGRPYLDGFPAMAGPDGLADVNPTMVLSNPGSDELLQAAANLAGRTGQSSPVARSWNVAGVDALATTKVGFVIARYADASMLAPIAEALWVRPEGNGFVIHPNCELLPGTLKGGAVLQAVASPSSPGGVLYVLLGEDEAAIARATRMIATPYLAERLTGQVAAFLPDGRTLTFKVVPDADIQVEMVKETGRFTPQMMGAVLVIAVLILAAILWTASKFRKVETTEDHIEAEAKSSGSSH